MTAIATKKQVTGFRLVLGYFGIFMVLVGLLTAVPMIIPAFYHDEWVVLPVYAGVVSFDVIVGLVLYFVFVYKRQRMRFLRHEEAMLLVLSWFLAILSGAAPFFILNLMGDTLSDMTFSAAVFESTSGYTTTGLTLFRDFVGVEGAMCSHVLTFHRAWLNFVGGMGLVLILASVLGTSGGGVSLYVSEGHSDQLVANMAKSAKLIFGIYLFYAILGFFSLIMAGMPMFDAACHAMSAISGGGFSCRDANVGYYRIHDGEFLDGWVRPVNSLAIEIIILVLVVLGALSFVLHTYILRFKWKLVFRDSEIRFMGAFVVFFVLIAFFGALAYTAPMRGSYFENGGEIFRQVLFYTVGSVTTSGFSTTTADATHFTFHLVQSSGGTIYMGHLLILVCIIMMLCGGGAGSTAGGIKQFRLVVMAKSQYYAMRYRFASIHQHYPKLVTRYGEQRELSDDMAREAFHYSVLFLTLFAASTIVVLIAGGTNYNVQSAAFDVASAISNTGLSIVIGPDFVANNPGAGPYVIVWVYTIGMFLGRLEIMPAAYAASNVVEEVQHMRELRRRAHRDDVITDAMKGE